jgi:Uma2 family endonuclease
MNAPARPLDIMPKAVPMTAAALRALDETGHFRNDPHRYELIEGVLHMTPPAGGDHWNTERLTARALTRALIAADLFDRYAVQSGAAFEIGPDTLLGPDLVLVENLKRIERLDGETALLVIEIAWSSRTFDTQDKARLYARAGVADYWVLDIPAKTVLVHRAPVDGIYTSVQAFEAPASIAPLRAPGLSVAVADLF